MRYLFLLLIGLPALCYSQSASSKFIPPPCAEQDPLALGYNSAKIRDIQCMPDSIRETVEGLSMIEMALCDMGMVDRPNGTCFVRGIRSYKEVMSDGTKARMSDWWGKGIPRNVNEKVEVTVINYKVSANLNYHFYVSCTDSFAYVIFNKHQYGEDGEYFYQCVTKEKDYQPTNVKLYWLQLSNGFALGVYGYDIVYKIITANKNVLKIPDYRFDTTIDYSPKSDK